MQKKNKREEYEYKNMTSTSEEKLINQFLYTLMYIQAKLRWLRFKVSFIRLLNVKYIYNLRRSKARSWQEKISKKLKSDDES